MDLATTKAARKEAKRMFTRTINQLKKLLTQQVPLKTLERRMEALTIKWNDVQGKHESYMTAAGEGVDEEEEDKWIDEIDVRYCEMESFLDKKIEERMKEMKEEVKQEESKEKIIIQAPPVPKTKIRIEHLKFKSFDGELRNFPRFKEEFEKHIKPLCTEMQLPLVLKSYLVDEVREEVENIGDNIKDIWTRLDKKYGDQGRLIDVILADVKGMLLCRDDQDTLNMIKIVERADCDLKRIGKQRELDNTTIISMLEQKMPEEMTNEWVKLITKDEDQRDNKFELLKKLFSEFRDRIEYKLANIRRMPENKYLSHHVNLPDTEELKRSKCWLHKVNGNGDHPIWRCRLFLSKSVGERIELVKRNKACYSCLETGHTDSDCIRGFICAERGCQRSHNRLLHSERSEFRFNEETKGGGFKDTLLLKQRNSTHHKKSIEQDTEIDQLKNILKIKESEYIKTISLSERLQSDILKLTKRLETHKEEMDGQEIKNKWSQNKLKAELEAHKETKKQVSLLATKLQESKEEGEQIRKDCHEMIERYQGDEEINSVSLRKQLEEQLKKQEEKDNLYTQQGKDFQEQAKQLNLITEDNGKLSQQLNDQKAVVIAVEGNNTNLAHQLLEKEKDCAEMKTLIDSLKEELKRLQDVEVKTKGYGVDICNLRNQVGELTQQLNDSVIAVSNIHEAQIPKEAVKLGDSTLVNSHINLDNNNTSQPNMQMDKLLLMVQEYEDLKEKYLELETNVKSKLYTNTDLYPINISLNISLVWMVEKEESWCLIITMVK